MNKRADSVIDTKNSTYGIVMNVMVAVLIVCFPFSTILAETIWTPSASLIGVYDDNIQFTRQDPEDDFIVSVEPALRLNYDQEITKFSTEGGVLFRNYLDNDELNDEIYRFNVSGLSNLSERFRLRGRYDFIKDTTLDSELEETGRVFTREERLSHNVSLAPSYNLTERMSVGLSGRYRSVEYDSETSVDYSVWDISLPIGWKLITQVDSIYVSPGYSYRDSDRSSSESYKLSFGWDHETTERLTVNLSLGARYTEITRFNVGASDVTEDSWNGLGALSLDYNFETGNLIIDFQHDLRNTASGDQVNVTSVVGRLRWNFTERMGLGLNGRYYYTLDEIENENDSSQFFQAGSELFYNLTENHKIFIAYDYSQNNREDLTDLPDAERNRVWAGIDLNFPMQ